MRLGNVCLLVESAEADAAMTAAKRAGAEQPPTAPVDPKPEAVLNPIRHAGRWRWQFLAKGVTIALAIGGLVVLGLTVVPRHRHGDAKGQAGPRPGGKEQAAAAGSRRDQGGSPAGGSAPGSRQAVIASGLELPPVHPTPPSAAPGGSEFGLAHAAYEAARQRAWAELRAQCLAERKKLQPPRAADREELERQLGIKVNEAPASEETAQSAQVLRERIAKLGNIQEAAMVSGLLGYADMAKVDRLAAFWQQVILPLARRCGGTTSAGPLLAVEGAWRRHTGSEQFQRLDHFRLRNDSGQALTHVVVELIAENEWHEQAAHYFYFPELQAGDAIRAVPHPRWNQRRLDFVNSLTVTFSVWADQGTDTGRQTKPKDPNPNPDPNGWRKDYLAYDQQYAVLGEALDARVQGSFILPGTAARHARLLRQAVTPGAHFLFRATGRAGVLRVLRFEPGSGAVEVEIYDVKTHQPLLADTPTWKGKIDRAGGNSVQFGLQPNNQQPVWILAIGPDDLPRILAPAGGAAARWLSGREVPLFAAQMP